MFERKRKIRLSPMTKENRNVRRATRQHKDVTKKFKELGDNTFVIKWFAGINCIILWSEFSFTATRQRSGKTGICDRKMIQFMPAKQSNTNHVITILIHSAKTRFENVSLSCYVALLRTWRRRIFHGINAMILMPQIFDVIANENARYKRNGLELFSDCGPTLDGQME